MYWDRCDICEAHLLLEMDFNEGGVLRERRSNMRRGEATQVQLARLKFKPTPVFGFDSLTQNGQEIYLENILKLKLPVDEKTREQMFDVFNVLWLRDTHPRIFLEEKTLNTRLLRAVWDGDAELVARMLAVEADVNVTNEDGESPLHWAAWQGDVDMMKLLVEAGADVNQQCKKGQTPAHQAARWADRIDALRFLCDCGADFSLRNHEDQSVIEFAQAHGHLHLAAMLESMVIERDIGRAAPADRKPVAI